MKKNAMYNYLDFDGDGLPELVVKLDGIYVLKYIPEENQVYLLYSFDTRSYLIGSGQIYSCVTGASRTSYYYFMLDHQGRQTTISFDIAFEEDGTQIYLVSIDTLKNINIGKENWDNIS